jgi:hypothetical protein
MGLIGPELLTSTIGALRKAITADSTSRAILSELFRTVKTPL